MTADELSTLAEAAEAVPADIRSDGQLFPVIEVFGPTIQGEGALAGLPTLFVRFGGCDYRCSWCDSMYAVDPTEVRENAVKMPADSIVAALLALISSGPPNGLWVTLSGGNPALMNFDRAPEKFDFIAGLQRHGFRVSVETQGSRWRDWLAEVDHLTISPKPPSSGMATRQHALQTERFLIRAEEMPYEKRSVKIVVFNDDDYDWARAFIMAQQNIGPMQTFLSVGTDQEHVMDEHRTFAGISDRYGWLCDKVAADPAFRNTRVLPQLHVLAFGTGRGV